MDIGIFVVRLFFGLAIAAHGSQKLFGWFGGHGIKGTGGLFETIGFRPGAAFAAAAGLSEFGGGLLMVLGLFTPFGAAAVFSAMIVAMVSVHLKNGFFAMGNGIESPFLYSVAGLALLFTGGGAISMDGLLRLNFLVEPYLATALIGLAVGGAAITLGMRHGVVSAPSKS
jgi:putative oxidoreductase